VNGKNSNIIKESQIALKTDQKKLRAVLQLRKRKSSTTLHQMASQRPRLQSPLSGPNDDHLGESDIVLRI
jgi:hypothetical protein